MNPNFPTETRHTTFKRYRENYDKDLKSFLEKNEVNTEKEFLEFDLYSHKVVLEHYLTKTPDYITADEGEINQINISNQRRIIEFIENKIQEATGTQEPLAKIKTLNWRGKELQFTELVKALFETKLISPELTQAEFFNRMKLFFNVDEFNENDKIKEIVNRSNTLTPFINILEISLINFRNKQLEKRKNK